MSDPLPTACGGWSSETCVGTPACPPRCPRFVDGRGAAWTFRPGDPADADSLRALYDAFGPSDRTQGLPPVPESRRVQWIDALLSEGYNVVAAGEDGLVGHAAYTPTTAARPELVVFVHPAFQGRGLGTELCKQVIAAAAAAGHEALELFVARDNAAALAVYRRLGFAVVERGRDFRMELPLTEPIAANVRRPPAEREQPA